MVVSFRVFKKSSPNGRLTVYLGRRDFIDHVTECDPVDGVLLIEEEYLKGRQVRSLSGSRQKLLSAFNPPQAEIGSLNSAIINPPFSKRP